MFASSQVPQTKTYRKVESAIPMKYNFGDLCTEHGKEL
jgi:hypothetical protein